MVDQLQEWQSDPAGKHRFRLHADGRPTDWVSDGTTVIHDPLPPAQAYPGVAGPSPQTSTVQTSAPGAMEPPAPVSEPVRPAGWYRSAANPSEVRYWDGSTWTDPPDEQVGGPPAINGRGDLAASDRQPAPSDGYRDLGGLGPQPAPSDGHRDLAGSARPATPGAPANWYPDPADRTRLRYWDGLGWTEQVIDEAPAHRP